jgi:DNA-binding NarL/FixJ family response regulator
LILVDANMRVVHYEPAAFELLGQLCPPETPGSLPNAIKNAVRSALPPNSAPTQTPLTVVPVPALIVHISHVFGGDSSFYALLLERESRRAPVDSAARRFSLTRREREVLRLMMRGLKASDIAKALSISRATVSGYFKDLLRKTAARSRSEMIAKVLDWEDAEAAAKAE